jgi:hypothetical protein
VTAQLLAKIMSGLQRIRAATGFGAVTVVIEHGRPVRIEHIISERISDEPEQTEK